MALQDSSELTVGTNVVHRVFGKGEIIASEGESACYSV